MAVSLKDWRGAIGSLQAGRGVAALLVVLFHAVGVCAAPKYFGKSPLGEFFRFGDLGVAFFFVLSGFIIYHVHRKDIGHRGVIGPYVRRRLTRIYPAYWIVLAGLLAALVLFPGLFPWRSTVDLIGSIVLFYPGAEVLTEHTYLTAAWTLYHEMLFYAVFLAFLVSVRLGVVLAALWAAGCLAQQLGIHLPLIPAYAFSPKNLLFAMGAGAAWLLNRGPVSRPALLAISGAAAFLMVGLFTSYVWPLLDSRYWLVVEDLRWEAAGLASMVAILGAVQLEISGRLRLWKPFGFLGDASYAIYLVHFPLLSLLGKVMAGSAALKALPVEAPFLIMVLICLVAGMAFHWIVELPILRLMRGRRVVPAVGAGA